MSQDPQANQFADQFNDELLSAYIDGELSAAELVLVEQRLADDPQARELVEELRALSDDLQALPQAKLGEDLRDVVLRQSEKAMLLGSDDSKTLPPTSDGGSPRWLWAALALAACLMLMFVMPEKKEEDPTLAAAKPQAEASAEQPGEREMRLEPPTAAAPAPEAEPASTAEIAAVEPAPSLPAAAGRSLGASVSEPRAAASAREFRATTVPTEEQEIEAQQVLEPDLQVVVTFNNGQQGLEQFDQFLLSNKIQTENNDSDKAISSRNAAAGVAGNARQLQQVRRGKDLVPAELVLLEAPAAQVEDILLKCTNEIANVAAVEVSSEKEESLPGSPERFNQYSRAIGQPNQFAAQQGFGGGYEADLADEVREGIASTDAAPAARAQEGGRAMRLDASQWYTSPGGKLNLKLQNQLLAKKSMLAKADPTSPLQVLFILQCPTDSSSSAFPLPAGARPSASAKEP